MTRDIDIAIPDSRLDRCRSPFEVARKRSVEPASVKRSEIETFRSVHLRVSQSLDLELYASIVIAPFGPATRESQADESMSRRRKILSRRAAKKFIIDIMP